MKKFFISISILLVVAACFSFGTFAEEIPEAVTNAVTEEIPAEPSEEIEKEATETTEVLPEEQTQEAPSFLSRLAESWEDGTIEKLLFIAAEIALAILVTIHRVSTNANYNALKLEAAEKTAANNGKTNELIDATNSAKAASEKTEKSIEIVKQLFENAKQIDKENALALEQKVDNCLTAVSEFAKMLQTAYNGSKMPQPVKDMINTSYVKIENIVSAMERAKNDTER